MIQGQLMRLRYRCLVATKAQSLVLGSTRGPDTQRGLNKRMINHRNHIQESRRLTKAFLQKFPYNGTMTLRNWARSLFPKPNLMSPEVVPEWMLHREKISKEQRDKTIRKLT